MDDLREKVARVVTKAVSAVLAGEYAPAFAGSVGGLEARRANKAAAIEQATTDLLDLFGSPIEDDGALTWETAPAGVDLWGVYGPDCFPTVFACQMHNYEAGRRAVWGYSVYKGEPGFRTLGVGASWATQHDLRLFRTRDEAFDYIAALFPPASS
jgi:hypothetical protein